MASLFRLFTESHPIPRLKMTKLLPLLALTAISCAAPGPAARAPVAPAEFDSLFTGKTLRFDYNHTGIAGEEYVSLDQVRLEGDWPGSQKVLVDDTGLGKYIFSVRDLETKQLIYSRGFCSIYGEWETIGEAKKGIWRTFHESQRFPEPRRKVQLELTKRSKDGSFRPIYSGIVDPASRFVNRSPLNAPGEVIPIFESGPAKNKVDFLILADGYSAANREKFEADVRRLVDAMFKVEPFASNRDNFNVRALHIDSARDGITNPRGGKWNDTPLGLSFNAFDSDRYVLSYKNRAIRESAALAPYDMLLLLGNTKKYGGGGIFNLWSTCTADSAQAAYVFVHELGHSFAGLADEYYTSSVSYEDFNPPGVEPWEPNITALLDPENLKWKDLVEEGTPLPTPWGQAGYDKASYSYQKKRKELIASKASTAEMEKLFSKVKNTTAPMLTSEKYADKVGAFEGAGYKAKGLYRSEADCIMFTRNPNRFCRVCSRGLERVIRMYTE